MKRKLTASAMTLLLCLSLCACGSMRSYNGTMTDKQNGTGTSGYTSDMMPDPDDGYVEEDTADDGVVDDTAATPAPSAKNRR